jgi:hypothetical protein
MIRFRVNTGWLSNPHRNARGCRMGVRHDGILIAGNSSVLLQSRGIRACPSSRHTSIWLQRCPSVPTLTIA